MTQAEKSGKTQTQTRRSAKERREAEMRKRQQQNAIFLGIMAVAIAAFVIIAIVISSRPLEAITPEAAKTSYEGYSTGRTADGFYFVGAENAPVVIEEFSSFSCSACLQYHDTVFISLKDKMKDGSLKFVYIPLTTYGSFVSDGMARGAICAGEQGKFWEMHDVMFDWQRRYGSSANDYKRLAGAAGALGLDTGKFSACLTAESTKQHIDKAVEYATKRSVSATPTVYLDGARIFPSLENGQDGPGTLSEWRGIIEDKIARAKQGK